MSQEYTVDELLKKLEAAEAEAERYRELYKKELRKSSDTAIKLSAAEGELNKIKQGGLTFVDTVELENLMKEEKLWAKKPLKPKK